MFRFCIFLLLCSALFLPLHNATLFNFSSTFYALCYLYIIFMQLFSLFCISFSRRVLSLIIIRTLRLPWQLYCLCSSSMVVIQKFFGFSNSHNSSSSLSITASQLWLLWLLSPFLHVTINGDHTPNR